MESQPQPEHPVTHLELLVELRVMQKELSTIRDALDRAFNGSASEIKELKLENRDLRMALDVVRIRMGQVVAISALLALVLPLLITMTTPRVQFGSHTHTMEQGNEGN